MFLRIMIHHNNSVSNANTDPYPIGGWYFRKYLKTCRALILTFTLASSCVASTVCLDFQFLFRDCNNIRMANKENAADEVVTKMLERLKLSDTRSPVSSVGVEGHARKHDIKNGSPKPNVKPEKIEKAKNQFYIKVNLAKIPLFSIKS